MVLPPLINVKKCYFMVKNWPFSWRSSWWHSNQVSTHGICAKCLTAELRACFEMFLFQSIFELDITMSEKLLSVNRKAPVLYNRYRANLKKVTAKWC